MNAIKLQAPPNTDDVVSLLSRLCVACEQDAKRFERASREVSNEELALLFSRYARRRSEFAKELGSHIDRMEGREPAPLSFVRVQSRKQKLEVARRDDGTILSDCEMAERVLFDLYEEALQHDLPDELQACLRRQSLAIRDVHAQMRDFCSALAWCAVPMAV
jgi:uncharacterized protein (TIGR02284 family)